MTYVELHCHSFFSFREGASTPLELILTAREMGYDAIALTDHDGLAGSMDFAQSARQWGIRGIIGAELTLRDGLGSVDAGGGGAVEAGSGGAGGGTMHLTVLAETQPGYANISRMISRAHCSSPRGEPALDPRELLSSGAGIVALSGCRQSEVARLAAAEEMGAACAAAWRYADLFGRANFFIELQDNYVRGDRARNRALVEVARRVGVGVVATNNVHYHTRLRHRLQDVLVATRHHSTLDASERVRRPNAEFYLKPPEEMERLFAEIPEAIANTRAIAERCRFDLTRDLTYRFPGFTPPENWRMVHHRGTERTEESRGS
ncbi:MAG: PHP domain-containing protein [Chloroflexi bacterium]|nr:PHP domain-containing protein [Chloroflexota bacterium]